MIGAYLLDRMTCAYPSNLQVDHKHPLDHRGGRSAGGSGFLVAGVSEPVGVSAGLNDGAAEGKSVNSRGAQPWVGKVFRSA